MDALEVAVLVVTAFLAGAINAIAGGGTLISFPGLLAAGLSPKVANVTNTVAIWPGMVGGSWAYREELSRQRATIRVIILPTLAGAVTGAVILLSTSESTFEALVPFLIVAACATLALQDRIARLVFREPHTADLTAGRKLVLGATMFVVAVYGAYFGAAMGIIVLAIFGLLLPDDIQHANALKGLFALFVNGVAAVSFAMFGDVAWDAAAAMAVATLVGGYLGVSVARSLDRDTLRGGVVAYGTVAAFVILVT